MPKPLSILLLRVKFLESLAILCSGLPNYSTDSLRQLIIGDLNLFLLGQGIEYEAVAARFCARVLMSSAAPCTRSDTCSCGMPAWLSVDASSDSIARCSRVTNDSGTSILLRSSTRSSRSGPRARIGLGLGVGQEIGADAVAELGEALDIALILGEVVVEVGSSRL